MRYKNICEEVVWQIFVYNYPGVPISVLFSIITLPNGFRHGVAGIRRSNISRGVSRMFDMSTGWGEYVGVDMKTARYAPTMVYQPNVSRKMHLLSWYVHITVESCQIWFVYFCHFKWVEIIIHVRCMVIKSFKIINLSFFN